jgi:hypothetical protein
MTTPHDIYGAKPHFYFNPEEKKSKKNPEKHGLAGQSAEPGTDASGADKFVFSPNIYYYI